MDKNQQLNTGLVTLISGSYRRHLTQLMALRKSLQQRGIAVLSPVGSASINPGAEFVILDADPVSDARLLQDSIFAKLRACSFHVLANFDSYLGRAAVMEIGYALAVGLQIYAVEAVDDPNIAPYCRPLSDVFPDLAGEWRAPVSSIPALPGGT